MSTVTSTSSESVATITLQRPESLNALDLATRQALLDALTARATPATSGRSY